MNKRMKIFIFLTLGVLFSCALLFLQDPLLSPKTSGFFHDKKSYAELIGTGDERSITLFGKFKFRTVDPEVCECAIFDKNGNLIMPVGTVLKEVNGHYVSGYWEPSHVSEFVEIRQGENWIRVKRINFVLKNTGEVEFYTIINYRYNSVPMEDIRYRPSRIYSHLREKLKWD